MKHEVVVVGSANADLVVEVSRRPTGGETLLGGELRTYAGGKGANQAAAAARAGGDVGFIGCVGVDGNGAFLKEQLRGAGVGISLLGEAAVPTGTAVIFVTPDGENSIVVSPGANSELTPARLAEAEPDIAQARVVILSLEIPAETAREAARLGAAHGARVVFNAAPSQRLDAETLACCDPLVVNEHEAREVLGAAGDLGFADLATGLLAVGARSVVITLGERGALVADASGMTEVPAHRVEVVDTTGAGDSFVGALGCELARGRSLQDAAVFATAMSAIAVQGSGAQSSYPDRDEIFEFLVARGRAIPE